MKIIYYAHCMDIYHTEQEEDDIYALTHLGFDVLNPSNDDFSAGWAELGMDYAKDLIGNCDALAFRRAKNGKVPGGVAMEIVIAEELNIPVIELPAPIDGKDVMTHAESRAYLEANPSEFYKKRMAERENV
jgi:hypothetical protein